MSKGQLKTEWIRVATEGTTVDGRTITKEWIEQMAQTYDPVEQSPALIWPEHRRFNWWEGKEEDNWGEVLELKSEKQGGKYRLFAVLRPNSHLLLANEKSQKLFTSIEPDPDFCETGKCYLLGLAVTDKPASTGTTRLQFSQSKSIEASATEPLNLDFQLTDSVKRSFTDKFFAFMFGEQTPTPDQNPDPEKEEDEMKTEQFNALTESIKALADGQAALQTTLTQHFSDQSGNGDQGNGGEPTSPNAEQTVTTEQFSQLTDSIAKLTDSQTKMQQQFSQLLEEDHSHKPDVSGGGDNKVECL